MKRTIYILILLIIYSGSTLTSEAQNKERRRCEFGIKTGLNISNTNIKNYSPKAGINIGAFLDVNFSRKLFLRAGLDYTTKGAKYSENLISSPISFGYSSWGYGMGITYFTGKMSGSYTLNYLQLPLTIGYRFPVSKNINLTVNAGGYISGGLSSKVKYHTDGTYSRMDEVFWVNDEDTWDNSWDNSGLERFDYGIMGGIGAEYKKFIFNINYEIGLNSLTERTMYLYGGNFANGYDYEAGYGGYYGQYTFSQWHNYNVTFSIGYKF